MQPTDTIPKCALHPDRAAQLTCPRCGNFSCAECVPTRETQCPSCQALTGQGAFPYDRDTFTLDRLWGHSFELWKREWIMLAVAYLIVTLAQWIGGMIGSAISVAATLIVGNKLGSAGTIGLQLVSNVSNNLLGTAVAGTFQMGFIRVTMDVLAGKRADLAQLLTQFRKLPRYLGLYFLTVVSVGLVILGVALAVLLVAAAAAGVSLSSLPELKDFDFARKAFSGVALIVLVLGTLVIIPIAMLAFSHFQLATFELVYTDCGPIEAIRRAIALTEHNRWTAVGYGVVAGVIIMVGVLACCIGIFPAAGLSELLMVSLFLSLRTPGGRST